LGMSQTRHPQNAGLVNDPVAPDDSTTFLLMTSTLAGRTGGVV
jgi:hypothetical protein